MPRLLPLIGLAGVGALAVASLTRASDTSLFAPLAVERADLSDYRWEKRPVLVFAASDNDPDYMRQVEILRAVRPALKERDIVVLTDDNPAQFGRLRTGLALDGFTVMLVGKDGGVKLQSDRPVEPDRLFALIDRMPMRRREMSE